MSGIGEADYRVENDTVWLSIDQMAELFQRDKSVTGKHVRNIFKEGELKKESVDHHNRKCRHWTGKRR